MPPNLTTAELARATAAAFRIVAEALIANGVDPSAIDALVEAKAHDLLLGQRDQNAAMLLRVMLGGLKGG